MDSTVTPRDLMLNLRAAGFEKDMVQEYLTAWEAGEIKEQLRLLAEKRKILLDHIHLEEKQIGCLDYLVYQIRKGTVTA